MSDAPAPGNGLPPEASGMTERRPPSLGEQLGLGINWTPVGVGYMLHPAKLQAVDGSNVHVFILDTPVGRFGVPMSDDDLRGLAKIFTERASGIVLADKSSALPGAGPLRTPGA